MPDTPTLAKSLYDNEVRTGKRAVTNIIWRYRRPADIQRPPMQSADLGDGTLPMAAAEGRTQDVQKLLMQGYNIESTGSRAVSDVAEFHGTTALFRAARNKHFETASLLLRSGANPNVMRSDGKSLLRLLSNEGELELVRLLLEYGAVHHKQGALPQAALQGHIGVVLLLLSYGADINEVEKQTALYRAASKGHSDVVELLLREGADTTFVAPSGPSALWEAVYNSHFRCVRSLLLYGARPEVGCGLDGETILFTASALGQEPIVRLLLERRARPNDVWYRPYQEPIQLRDGRVEAFFPDAPLHAAARGGRLSIARSLVEYGADVNLKTHFDQTAIDIAYARGYRQLVEMLYSAGARLDPMTVEAVENRAARKRDENRYKTDQRRLSRHLSTSNVNSEWDERRAPEVQDPRSLQIPPDWRRRTKSSSTIRSEGRSKKSSGTSSLGVAAAGALLLDSLMLLT
jgi:ankyrin repeat protein